MTQSVSVVAEHAVFWPEIRLGLMTRPFQQFGSGQVDCLGEDDDVDQVSRGPPLQARTGGGSPGLDWFVH